MRIFILISFVVVFNLVDMHPVKWPRYFLMEDDIAGVSPWLMQSRSGLKKEKYRWPNATVPYVFAPNYPKKLIGLFELAIEHISSQTCVKFVPRTDEPDYIKVIEGNGCYAYVGRLGRKGQEVSLPWDCGLLEIFVHELIHSIGFFHEQSRSDREKYVDIIWENIRPEHEHNFMKYDSSVVSSFGVDYDYDSLMHYPSHAFSKNGGDTIVTKPPGIPIGQLNRMSTKDVLKVNRMYNCTTE